LPTAAGYKILRSILLYGFIIAILIIILGFTLRHRELTNQQRTVGEIETMLREALDSRPAIPEQKRSEIIKQMLDGYRRGELSKEQIENWVEEINVSSTQNLNYISESNLTRNQVRADTGDTDKNKPPSLATGSWGADQSASNPIPYTADQSQHAQTSAPTNNGVNSQGVLVWPFNLAPNTCAVSINWPPDGASIGNWTYISGTVELPANQHLLVFVRFGTNKWGRGRDPRIDKKGKWSGTVPLGKDNQFGSFNIAAVVVDEQTVRDIENGAKTLDSTDINFGCSLATVTVNKTEIKDNPPPSMSCPDGHTVSCAPYAASCSCDLEVGCISYDDKNLIVKGDFCSGGGGM
jgi:hypothetical protein